MERAAILLALLVAGCAEIGPVADRPDPSGVYIEKAGDKVWKFEEKFTFRADGSGTSGLSFILIKSGKPVSAAKGRGKGNWFFRGERLIFEATSTFTSDLDGVASPVARRTKDVFEIDANGDLLRIAPRNQPYIAGRFVKQR